MMIEASLRLRFVERLEKVLSVMPNYLVSNNRHS